MESKLSELRSVLGETCICDLSLLGCWKGDSNLENLKLEFCTGLPFPNVVIEDFLEPDFALVWKIVGNNFSNSFSSSLSFRFRVSVYFSILSLTGIERTFPPNRRGMVALLEPDWRKICFGQNCWDANMLPKIIFTFEFGFFPTCSSQFEWDWRLTNGSVLARWLFFK